MTRGGEGIKKQTSEQAPGPDFVGLKHREVTHHVLRGTQHVCCMPQRGVHAHRFPEGDRLRGLGREGGISKHWGRTEFKQWGWDEGPPLGKRSSQAHKELRNEDPHKH